MDAEWSLRDPGKPSHYTRSKRRAPLPGLGWLLVAVGLCWLSWPAPAEAQPVCAHDLCEVGDDLNAGCDPGIPGLEDCVSDICNGLPGTQGDPYCCDSNGLWDDNCVDQVLTVCGSPICAAVCKHSPCEIGDPLDSTCNACTAFVCFDMATAHCCDPAGSWDAACVAAVQQAGPECGYECEPGENLCSNAQPITPGKILGTLFGSSNDGKESLNQSNLSGDVWYEYTQGPADGMLLYTCATQRSFGIDTVLSVHGGATVQDRCPGKPNNEIIANDDWDLGLTQACENSPDPKNVDAAVPLGGAFALEEGETVVIRIAHHKDSVQGNFELRLLPEPAAWMALVAGVGALGALSRWRARG